MRDLTVLIDEQRLTVYPRMLLAIYAFGIGMIWWNFTDLIDPTGNPFGYDFITFWSAGWLTLMGNGVGAFDPDTILAAQQYAVEGVTGVYLWHYPPTYQLVAAGLALMPYMMAYFVFVGLGLAVFVAVMKPLVPWRHPVTLLLALPGVFLCAVYGQNSLLSAALFAAAIVCLDRRPALAGICIGLLAFKPQLGVLIPLALLITGQWRTIWSAAATVVVFCGVATAVLGFELWQAFFANFGLVREVMETGLLPWSKMPSAFIFLRMLGMAQELAYAMQAVVAAAAATATLYVWWRAGATRLSWAALICGTMLLPPYTFNYELVILTVPLAIIVSYLIQRGTGTTWWEALMLVSIIIAPFLLGPVVERIGIQIGFLVLAAAFVWSVRLALAEKAPSVERQASTAGLSPLPRGA